MADAIRGLQISLDQDNTAAIAKIKEFREQSKRIGKEVLNDAEVKERAHTELIKRENNQRIQEVAKASKTEIEIKRDQKRAEEQAVQAASAQEKRLKREAAAFNREVDREVAKAARESQRALNLEKKLSVDFEKSLEREKASDFQRVMKQIADSQKALNKELGGHQKEWASESKRVVGDHFSTIGKWNQEAGRKIEEHDNSVNKLIGSYIGISAAVGGIRTLADIWKSVGDEQRRAFEDFIRFQKESRVGAAVQGVSPGQYAAETIKASMESGLPFSEADNLNRQFRGSLPAGLQKGNITEKVANEFLNETAKTGARLGGDQGTRGELAGILPSFEKIGSVGEGMAKMEAIRFALTEGRGDDSPLSRSLLNVAGKLEGTMAEKAALIGVTSQTAGPMMADTRAVQLTRAVRGTTAKQMANLEKEFGIKVGSKMSLEDRLGAMVPKLREIGKRQDLMSWLTNVIGTPQEDAEALMEMLPNFEMLKGRMATAREMAAGNGSDVMDLNRKFLSTSDGRTQQARAQSEGGRFAEGSRTAGFQSLVAKFQALRNAQPDGFMKTLEDYSPASLFASPAERAALEHLTSMTTKQDRFSMMPGTAANRGQAMFDMIQGRGGDPFAEVDSKLGSTLGPKLDRILTQLQKMERPGAMPSLPDPAPPSSSYRGPSAESSW